MWFSSRMTPFRQQTKTPIIQPMLTERIPLPRVYHTMTSLVLKVDRWPRRIESQISHRHWERASTDRRQKSWWGAREELTMILWKSSWEFKRLEFSILRRKGFIYCYPQWRLKRTIISSSQMRWRKLGWASHIKTSNSFIIIWMLCRRYQRLAATYSPWAKNLLLGGNSSMMLTFNWSTRG